MPAEETSTRRDVQGRYNRVPCCLDPRTRHAIGFTEDEDSSAGRGHVIRTSKLTLVHSPIRFVCHRGGYNAYPAECPKTQVVWSHTWRVRRIKGWSAPSDEIKLTVNLSCGICRSWRAFPADERANRKNHSPQLTDTFERLLG